MSLTREVSSLERAERFVLAAAKERWLEFLALEHETLPLPIEFSREGDDLLVRRARFPGRRICAGRIPRQFASSLFLQAAAAISFLQAHGFWLDEEDLTESLWESADGSPRLWLTRTPAAVRRGGPGPAPSAVLAAFLHRLFARGKRIGDPAARALFDRLLAPDAAARRSEFWLASVCRAFPALSSSASSAARARTLGYAGTFLRDASRRALLAKARALLTGRSARVFASCSPLTPAGALDLREAPAGAAEAARWLRQRHAREAQGLPAVWIAVEPQGWDSLSRRAFETARKALGEEIESVEIPPALSPPLLPDEWRREIYVPCGTLRASLRFYERFAELAGREPSLARRIAVESVSSSGWGAFAGDATGDAPLPLSEVRAPTGALLRAADPLTELESDVLDLLSLVEGPVTSEEVRLVLPRASARCLGGLRVRGYLARDRAGQWKLTSEGRAKTPDRGSPRRDLSRRWARVEKDPGRKIELLISAGDLEEALQEGERWFRTVRGGPAENWFELSSRLGQAAGERMPSWLALLEAEREIAGGRLEEAESRLARIEQEEKSTAEERRSAMLRRAEVRAFRADLPGARRRSAAWRRAFPDAPASETVRALHVEAACRAREGEHEPALLLLEEAGRLGQNLPLAERVETALARAGVYSLAGRFREEREVYDAWRPALLSEGDEALLARFLAREALGLSDRRDFSAAAARLEEARAVLQDDPVQRAKVCMDLASTLYHAGRTASCASLLEEAISFASLAGREDLSRIARGNRLEILINRGEWETASAEIEELAASARLDRDDLRLLVALHHGSRLSLRRGHLERAARENGEARDLASRLRDRLEIGELWLEEGDRLVYEGQLEEAERAYELAATDPPDRCDSADRAKERLGELGWRGESQPPASAFKSLAELFERDEYAAAETLARWRALFPGSARETPFPPELTTRAEYVLRSQGGEALADRVFGRGASVRPVSDQVLRTLRDAVARALTGDEPRPDLSEFAISGLLLADTEAREIVRFGKPAEEKEEIGRRRLDAGSATYELSLWPSPREETLTAVALLLETLLFRVSAPAPAPGYSEGFRRFGIVAADAAMEEPYRRLCRFAAQPVTVLVLGESGTGKEAVARAVHQLSPRASGPFVPVNVAAIPAPLLESELFGHVRGAFTGAERDRRGLMEEAERGTIFFDEIGDLSAPLQAKLLRALQEREIRRVGDIRARRVDVRVVSATARDLAREVEAGRFREDLYYRLNVAVVLLPPLRQRGRDVFLLARHFLEHYTREYGRGELKFAPEALAALGAHTWPGNVRELQNVISQAAALAEENGVVPLSLLPEPVRRERRASGPPADYRSRVDAHRRDMISEALERTGGNRSRAARDLGLSRQALLYLIRELNIPARPRTEH